jgi:hypothetical protein
LNDNKEIVKRMEMRFKVPKETNHMSLMKSKTEIRPLFQRLRPYGAVQSRSPLVSMIFPSMNDKKKVFLDEQVRKDQASGT